MHKETTLRLENRKLFFKSLMHYNTQSSWDDGFIGIYNYLKLKHQSKRFNPTSTRFLPE